MALVIIVIKETHSLAAVSILSLSACFVSQPAKLRAQLGRGVLKYGLGRHVLGGEKEEGALTLESSKRMCHPFNKTPFFRPFYLVPETHHFKTFSGSRVLTSIFGKLFIFKPNFLLLKQFQRKLVLRLQFQAKISVTETLVLKTWVAHTYPKLC